MVGLREAVSIAKKHWDGFDNYLEYEKCFVFGKTDDDSIGGEGPIVVMKETGEAVNFIWALTNDMFGDIDEDGMKEPIPLEE